MDSHVFPLRHEHAHTRTHAHTHTHWLDVYPNVKITLNDSQLPAVSLMVHKISTFVFRIRQVTNPAPAILLHTDRLKEKKTNTVFESPSIQYYVHICARNSVHVCA